MNLIFAHDQNNGIGKNNTLPWKAPNDLKRFLLVTKNNIVVMGRKTWDSLPKKPLSKRENYVISSQNITLNGATVLHSFEEVLKLAKERQKSIYIIGGVSLFQYFEPYAKTIFESTIIGDYLCDTFYEFDKSKFRTLYSQRFEDHLFTLWTREEC